MQAADAQAPAMAHVRKLYCKLGALWIFEVVGANILRKLLQQQCVL